MNKSQWFPDSTRTLRFLSKITTKRSNVFVSTRTRIYTLLSGESIIQVSIKNPNSVRRSEIPRYMHPSELKMSTELKSNYPKSSETKPTSECDSQIIVDPHTDKKPNVPQRTKNDSPNSTKEKNPRCYWIKNSTTCNPDRVCCLFEPRSAQMAVHHAQWSQLRLFSQIGFWLSTTCTV